MGEWKVEFYEDKKGNRPVEEFLDKLPKHKKARVIHLLEMLKDFGISLGKPYVKHIEDKIWELRPGSVRVFYFIHTGRIFVLLHAITKKTRKTPRRAIIISTRRMYDYEYRAKN